MRIGREATTKIIQMIDEGTLTPDSAVTACLSYMSESDVLDMAESNDFFTEEELGK